MKVVKSLRWLVVALLLIVGLSACGSSRISPQLSVGVPTQKGKAPDVGFKWY